MFHETCNAHSPRVAVLAMTAVIAACSTADIEAPTLAGDVPQTFLALDEDRDGRLSRLEAAVSPLLLERFGVADANYDGMLDRYEFNSPGWRPFAGEPGESAAAAGASRDASSTGSSIPSQPPAAPSVASQTLRAGELIGMPVRTGEKGAGGGRIEDLVLDLTHGRVHFAVIELQGERLSLPLPHLRFPRGEGYALLEAPRDEPVPPRTGMRLVHASEVLGRPVMNSSGARIGTLTGMMVDVESGHVRFAELQKPEDARAPMRVALQSVELPMMKRHLVLR